MRVSCSPTSVACAKPQEPERKEENGNVDGPGSWWCEPWTLVMEGPGELQLDAKAEVSPGARGRSWG